MWYELERYDEGKKYEWGVCKVLIDFERWVVVRCIPSGKNKVDLKYLSRSEITREIREELNIPEEPVCGVCFKRYKVASKDEIPYFIKEMVLKCGCGMRFSRNK